MTPPHHGHMVHAFPLQARLLHDMLISGQHCFKDNEAPTPTKGLLSQHQPEFPFWHKRRLHTNFYRGRSN
jgi:hypothetical protein